MNTIRLSQLKVGKSGKIVRVHKSETDKYLNKLLLDMGIIKGITVKVLRLAPMNDPIEIALNNFCLTIRKNEAKIIEIEEDI